MKSPDFFGIFVSVICKSILRAMMGSSDAYLETHAQQKQHVKLYQSMQVTICEYILAQTKAIITSLNPSFCFSTPKSLFKSDNHKQKNAVQIVLLYLDAY